MKVIAVDFDGTMCRNAWPEIGKANVAVLDLLRFRKAQGDKIILWTCRSDKLLTDAVEWCEARGLHFDAVNDNLPENIARYGNNCRKVWADYYVDDKAVLVQFEDDPYISYRVQFDSSGNHSCTTLTPSVPDRVGLLVRIRKWKNHMRRRWQTWRFTGQKKNTTPT